MVVGDGETCEELLLLGSTAHLGAMVISEPFTFDERIGKPRARKR